MFEDRSQLDSDNLTVERVDDPATLRRALAVALDRLRHVARHSALDPATARQIAALDWLISMLGVRPQRETIGADDPSYDDLTPPHS